MTEQGQSVSASDALEPLCEKVSLRRTALTATGDTALPHGAALWSSSYARLLLWPIDATENRRIAHAALAGEQEVDRLLTSAEESAGHPSIDGYLVLALAEAPSEDSRELIRELELSSRICRKHCIWPARSAEADAPADGWWRIADVTVLGLPDGQTTAEGGFWPKLDPEAQAIWNEIQPAADGGAEVLA